jgi:hypothetical protein
MVWEHPALFVPSLLQLNCNEKDGRYFGGGFIYSFEYRFCAMFHLY